MRRQPITFANWTHAMNDILSNTEQSRALDARVDAIIDRYQLLTAHPAVLMCFLERLTDNLDARDDIIRRIDARTPRRR